MTRAVLDRTRLASILGMMGSDALSERAAAAAMASKMVRAAGLTWADVLQPAPTSRPRSRRQPAPQSPAFNQQRAAALEMCRHHAGHLTPWEVGFVSSIATRRTLSPKQLAVLTGIAADLAGRVAK